MIDAKLLARLADELDAARKQVETLGVALCGHPELVRHVTVEMQSLDHVAQRCDNIARILRAPDMLEEGNASGLESIRLAVKPFSVPLTMLPNHDGADVDGYFWDDGGTENVAH
jgi:hypothetical protein